MKLHHHTTLRTNFPHADRVDPPRFWPKDDWAFDATLKTRAQAAPRTQEQVSADAEALLAVMSGNLESVGA